MQRSRRSLHLSVYEKGNPASYACEVRLWISYFKCLPSLLVKQLLKLKKKNAVIPRSVKGLAFPIDWTSFDLLFLIKFCDSLETGNASKVLSATCAILQILPVCVLIEFWRYTSG